MESDFGSIPFTDNPAAPGRGPAPPPPSSSASSSQPVEVSGGKLTVKEFITFDQPLKIDRLSKKLEEFNTKQPDESTFAPQLKSVSHSRGGGLGGGHGGRRDGGWGRGL